MKLNDIVELTFDDHFFGAAKLAPCKAYGKVTKITNDLVVLMVWEPLAPERDEVDGREFIAVARKTIKKIRRLIYEDA